MVALALISEKISFRTNEVRLLMTTLPPRWNTFCVFLCYVIVLALGQFSVDAVLI